jgi:hypothetical protein
MEEILTTSLRSMRWILRSLEDEIRAKLKEARFKVISLAITIETEPRTLSTPTYHRFALQAFLQLDPEMNPSTQALSPYIAATLGIPEGHRFSFGKSMEKPGLWQLLYKSRHQWTDWESEA